MPAHSRILHLVDDATPGGVTRVLDHIRSCRLMAQTGQHEVKLVSPRGALPDCEADMVVSHLSLNWRRVPSLIAFRARYPGLPLVHVEHSYTEMFTALNVRSKLRFFAMLRTAYAMFDTVVAVSDGQASWLRKRRLVADRCLCVIPPAVALEGFRALSLPARTPRVFGAIGRLHRQKGFDILIEAFRKLPDPGLALHIYGAGPDQAALCRAAAADPRIRFIGHVERSEEIIQSVDIVAMPSRWEAFGLVALEARAAGRPIICSGVDGLSMSAGSSATVVHGFGIAAWHAALQAATGQSRRQTQLDRAASCEKDFASAWHRLIQSHTEREVTAQTALLPISGFEQTSPFPGHTYPAG